MSDKLLSYPLDNDQEVFKKGHVTLGNKTLVIEACTVAGSKDGKSRKPNEDAYSIISHPNTLLAAVFDGASSQKPIPALKEETGARFASHFLKQTLENSKQNEPTNDLIRTLNKNLLNRIKQFEGTSLQDVHTLPSSTATIVQIDTKNNQLHISHVGDTFCMLYNKDHSSKYITIDRNKFFDDQTLAILGKIAQKNHITPREAKKDEKVKTAIIEMFQNTFNKADGSGQGIINGDPKIEQYIQDIAFPLDAIHAIFIGSDGIIPPGMNEQNENDQKLLFDTIESGGLKKLFQLKQSIEDNDPDWKILRYKHSDDATGIYITFND